jgi:hypothetical protein
MNAVAKEVEARAIPEIFAVPGEDMNGIPCVGFFTGEHTAVFVPKDDLDNGVITKEEVWQYITDLAYENNDIVDYGREA